MVNINKIAWNNWSKECEDKRDISPKSVYISNNEGDNMGNENRNALEPLADSLVEGIASVGTVAVQASINVLMIGIKASYQLVKLVVDVGGIAYRVGTGSYEYEAATTKELEGKQLKTITDINYKITDYEEKAINLDNKFLNVGGFETGTMKDFIKYESCCKSDKLDLKACVGVNEFGEVQEVDFFKDGSLLIGGASRWGKTNIIYSIILSLMERYSENYLKMLLVDFKRVDLVRLDKYKNVIGGCICDSGKLNDMLNWIEKECDKRVELFNKLDVVNIEEYNSVSEGLKLSPIIVVIDEIAQVLIGDKKEVDKLRARLFKLISKCMCFGVYFIVCTQELSRETLGKMKNNFTQTIGTKCADKTASDLVIKDADLETIKTKGRAKIDSSEGVTEFQGYYTTKDDFIKLLADKRK